MSLSARIEKSVTRSWYGSGGWTLLFLPLSFLYFLVISFRGLLHRRPAKSAVPVIVVGNITAGGTGKSPLVSYIVRYFSDCGYRVGIVSRGYGVAIAKDEVRFVEEDSAATEVGDEPLMLKRMLKCEIALSPQRNLALKALEKKGVQIVVADDGLQHYPLYRDIEICVVDGARGLGNGYLIPAGPLRESSHRLQSIDHCVVNGELQTSIPQLESQFISTMQLEPIEFVSLTENRTFSVDEFLAEYSSIAFSACAAIGNPKRFFLTLEKLGIDIQEERAFPDHHAYGRHDFLGIDGPVLMTEKDAAKCRTLNIENAWYLRVQPQLQDNLGDKLYNLLNERGRLAKTA